MLLRKRGRRYREAPNLRAIADMKRLRLKAECGRCAGSLKRIRWLFGLYLVLRVLVILVMIAQFFNGNYENVFFVYFDADFVFVPSLSN